MRRTVGGGELDVLRHRASSHIQIAEHIGRSHILAGQISPDQTDCARQANRIAEKADFEVGGSKLHVLCHRAGGRIQVAEHIGRSRTTSRGGIVCGRRSSDQTDGARHAHGAEEIIRRAIGSNELDVLCHRAGGRVQIAEHIGRSLILIERGCPDQTNGARQVHRNSEEFTRRAVGREQDSAAARNGHTGGEQVSAAPVRLHAAGTAPAACDGQAPGAYRRRAGVSARAGQCLEARTRAFQCNAVRANPDDARDRVAGGSAGRKKVR